MIWHFSADRDVHEDNLKRSVDAQREEKEEERESCWLTLALGSSYPRPLLMEVTHDGDRQAANQPTTDE